MKKKSHMILCILLLAICLTGCLKTKAIIYEDYQGPILPLSAANDVDGIIVERNVVVNYSSYSYETDDTRIVKIADQNILKNTTDKDITVELAYGYAAAYSAKWTVIPKVVIDNMVAESQVVIGRIPMRYGAELGKRGYFLENREDFENLLKDGRYQSEALVSSENVPVFSKEVTVYKFEDIGYAGDDEEIQNPGVGIYFDYNPEKTELYCYGIDTYSDKNKENYFEFGIPADGSTKDVYIIAIGDEIDIRDVVCYRHRMSDKELEGFSVKYKKYESNFDEVLCEIVEDNKTKYNDLLNSHSVYGQLTNEQVFVAGKQYIADMRELEYDKGRPIQLEGYLFEPMGGYCVYYQTAEVTVPANGSLDVTLEYEKYIGIKNIDDTPYDGLEIMSTLGSNLNFQKQTLKVIGLDQTIISEHTTGEGLENGAAELELTEDYFEIYLDVPEREYRNGTKRIW